MQSFAEFIVEDTNDYQQWGWIDPHGKFVDGKHRNGVSTHPGLLKVVSGLKMDDAMQDGWIRFFNLKGATYFEFFKSSKTLNRVIDFIHTSSLALERYVFDVSFGPNRKDHRFPGSATGKQNAVELLTQAIEYL